MPEVPPWVSVGVLIKGVPRFGGESARIERVSATATPVLVEYAVGFSTHAEVHTESLSDFVHKWGPVEQPHRSADGSVLVMLEHFSDGTKLEVWRTLDAQRYIARAVGPTDAVAPLSHAFDSFAAAEAWYLDLVRVKKKFSSTAKEPPPRPRDRFDREDPV